MPTLPRSARAWAESFGGPVGARAARRRGAIVARAADGMRAAGFAEPLRWRYDWGRAYTRDAWLEAVQTGGDVAGMTPAQLEALLGGLAAALDDRFTMPYAAVAISAITRET